MNLSIKNTVGLCLSMLFLGACNDFLEENPDLRVELNTLDKAQQLLTNAYSEGGYNFVEWMGDMVTYTQGTTKEDQHNQSYAWEEVDELFQDSPTFFWNETYEAIAHANEVLAVVDQLPGDEAQRRAVKGEALLARAYGHFMLVNLFAKHYDPSSASSDPGVPYVTTPETEFVKQYKRVSVQKVYDNIEDDLLEGLELVDGSFLANSGKYHFTKNSALAFASRFYLYQGDYNRCIEYSNQLLGSNPDVYIKDLAALLEERVNTEDYVRLFTSPNDPSNLLLIRKVTNFHLNVGYWPDSEVYSGRIFGNNPFQGAVDLRSDPAFVRGENGISASRFEFLFERTSLTSGVGFNYTIVAPFRGEEVLLNRAESLAQLNRVNEALADLQLLWNKRYSEEVSIDLQGIQSYIGTTDSRVALLIYILEIERPKEFVHEGLRWFDIKRYGFPVTHVLANGSTITLEADDNRKALQIPEAAQNVGGLSPNPR
ncbi:RagB/SusD family nutrient uptake outer membrane protein [Porifericola rhodea]|uniref:RagB/SusD family nutrient uptake outer membrane protein n=1 Tax=Porifericola rhodea TaxID=930972 RepID=UPI00266549FF|nr:RagB/SusD family nutrient uptake outer membrane protein [Porifericola rhodea]WKN31632.1 RagB/SusD family nutrient uptake outer membrane protein [Porifericola rhodea]